LLDFSPQPSKLETVLSEHRAPWLVTSLSELSERRTDRGVGLSSESFGSLAHNSVHLRDKLSSVRHLSSGAFEELDAA
jgi:hypothetical protein